MSHWLLEQHSANDVMEFYGASLSAFSIFIITFACESDMKRRVFRLQVSGVFLLDLLELLHPDSTLKMTRNPIPGLRMCWEVE